MASEAPPYLGPTHRSAMPLSGRAGESDRGPVTGDLSAPGEPCRFSRERPDQEIRGPYPATDGKARTQLPAPRNRALTGTIRVPYNGPLARECEGFGHERLKRDSGESLTAAPAARVTFVSGYASRGGLYSAQPRSRS